MAQTLHMPDPGLLVYDIDLDAFAPDVMLAFEATLDSNEHARAQRFATPALQRRFVAAHGAVRQVLAGLMGLPPSQLQFEQDLGGKPRIRLEQACGMHFNLSHCGPRALLAVAQTPVGIDLERWIERDTVELAREVLAEVEHLRFQDHPPLDQPRELARYWTAKEALLKACGLGLQVPPQDVVIDVRGGWHRLPPPAEPASWWLQALDVGEPFCAFVASGDCRPVTVRRHA